MHVQTKSQGKHALNRRAHQQHALTSANRTGHGASHPQLLERSQGNTCRSKGKMGMEARCVRRHCKHTAHHRALRRQDARRSRHDDGGDHRKKTERDREREKSQRGRERLARLSPNTQQSRNLRVGALRKLASKATFSRRESVQGCLDHSEAPCSLCVLATAGPCPTRRFSLQVRNGCAHLRLIPRTVRTYKSHVSLSKRLFTSAFCCLLLLLLLFPCVCARACVSHYLLKGPGAYESKPAVADKHSVKVSLSVRVALCDTSLACCSHVFCDVCAPV